MSLIRWHPFRDMWSLRDAIDRVFEERFTRPSSWLEGMGDGLIRADMRETDDALIVTADLPGLKPEDIDITVRANTLTIEGELQSKEEGERGNVHFRERRYGKYRRSVSLPEGVDSDAVEAEFKNGVLEIVLPKTEQARPKQVPVKARS